jgi:hypothetical protein
MISRARTLRLRSISAKIDEPAAGDYGSPDLFRGDPCAGEYRFAGLLSPSSESHKRGPDDGAAARVTPPSCLSGCQRYLAALKRLTWELALVSPAQVLSGAAIDGAIR